MNSFGRFCILLFFLQAFSVFYLKPVCADEAASPALKKVYNIIAGDWQRSDGNYRINVSEVQKEGQVNVKYFNPRPIHIANANVSTEKEMIKLFIKFQDKGYEGSTYRLYYYAQKDALVGFYYQAPTDRTYQVIFLRKIQ